MAYGDDYLNDPVTKYMHRVLYNCLHVDGYYTSSLIKSSAPLDVTLHRICRERVFAAQNTFLNLPNEVFAQHLGASYVYT